MNKLLSTKEVARKLGVNEKMVYALISDKGLPASKVTGKWLFPDHLVDQWVESRTINYPEQAHAERREDLLVVCGSNDLLLERALSLLMSANPELTAVFGNLGSLGGLRALHKGICQIAASHLAQEDGGEYNFSFAKEALDELPAVVNFARREQVLLLPPGNPRGVRALGDLAAMGLSVANRPPTTGTRLLFDRELAAAGIDASSLPGYERELPRHMDVGLAVLRGEADCGPAIRPVASLLGLDFLPLGWERFDLLIPKDRFFDKPVQLFLSMLPGARFHDLAQGLDGYDLSISGKMIFPE